ncbi:MmcQ/YjbR family DNA-binding protein [Streptomyces sp. NPDC002454]|uniref:MmcQ/YjbR family DNA-binding protein n=1 Tax=Streptomyces sp. NPDC002490 TaxID=3154416 RepID=UPI0033247456
MTPGRLRALCLSFNAAVEEFPFGPDTPVYKVRGRMFALIRPDRQPLTVNLKCDPEDAVRLRADHPGVVLPGYHMNKRHWNTVTVGELPARQVRELVEDSYDLVVAGLPRAERLRLDRP